MKLYCFNRTTQILSEIRYFGIAKRTLFYKGKPLTDYYKINDPDGFYIVWALNEKKAAAKILTLIDVFKIPINQEIIAKCQSV